MTFKPGKYKTRDGRDAVVLCDDAPGFWPLVGYIVLNGEASAWEWRRNGQRYEDDRKGLEDLMPPEPEQVVLWVYLWNGGETTTNSGDKPCFYRGFTLGDNALVARARVVLKPGQFDDENTPDPYTKGWNEALEAASNALNDAVMYERDRTEAGHAIRVLKRSAP